ncbi:MAG: hypothetical protein JST68_07030 [Bacteroidetes bacterium]|nr:hypothetical protein [Bacteroidota bacterium]
MSNERPDEFFSWRSRLNAPEALPEQGLENKDITWDRLSQRLHERPRRRRAGYWIAAACLLLALIPAARFLHHLPQPAVPPAIVTSPTAVNPQSPAANPKPVIANPLPAVELAEPILKSQPIKLIPRKLTPAHINPPAIAITPPPPAAVDSPILIAQQPAPPDTPKKLITKQLRIVHVNDLNASGHPEPAMTSIRDREPQIKILVVLKNH